MKKTIENTPRWAAEWEPQQCVLLTLPTPQTDWAYMLPDIIECYRGILAALIEAQANPILLTPDTAYAIEALGEEMTDNIGLVEAEYNDTWIRDYGPLTLFEDGKRILADFQFNGWGGKFEASKDNDVTQHYLKPYFKHGNTVIREENYVLEGGSMETDGAGTVLTTTRCLCSSRRNGGKTKEEVEDELRHRLGAKHILWLNYGHLQGDDTDGHVDTLARLCPDDTIIFTGCTDTEDEHYKELQAMKRELQNMRTAGGRRFNLMELPLPDAVYDPEDGHRLPATYANFLVTDRAVLVPAYGNTRKDRLARMMVNSVYADRIAVSVPALALLRQHGSLHCATMQITADKNNR